MGCNSQECQEWEKPVHEICTDGFWLGKYEVTQEQWKNIMGDHLFAYPDDKHPAEMLTWEDTQTFIEKLEKKTDMKYRFRLPTEVEWEYACRSCGKQDNYPGYAKIKDINRIIWYGSVSNGSTHPIGTREPNELGIYDMGGNVWEWCSDMYVPDAYSKHQTYNPVIGDGTDRVIRGGSWSSSKEEVRCTYRIGSPPEKRSNDIGFRLVMMPVKKQ
jgi:formylglycine-generating enzyme required for sulfatase activity